ncbi:MAG: hypothetical protein IPL26_01295 [Leptospiraceae bacterium]|nr:hypothetical protein [Leptospiraceae bacterium]
MLWQKIKSGFKLTIDSGKHLFSKIFSEAIGETKNTKFRFFFISTSIMILFFIIFILIGKNPFSLLLPLSVYDLPSIDKRTLVTLYISDGKNNLLKSKRKILLADGNIQKNLQIILGELSKPPYDDEIESTEENVFPKKLPDLKSSIISAWFLDSNKKLILDFNEAGIQKELSSIRVKLEVPEDESTENESKEEEVVEKKRLEELQKARVKILNTALTALEKTIFENFSSIESFEIRLNGESKQFLGLEYNLTELKKRN